MRLISPNFFCLLVKFAMAYTGANLSTRKSFRLSSRICSDVIMGSSGSSLIRSSSDVKLNLFQSNSGKGGKVLVPLSPSALSDLSSAQPLRIWWVSILLLFLGASRFLIRNLLMVIVGSFGIIPGNFQFEMTP